MGVCCCPGKKPHAFQKIPNRPTCFFFFFFLTLIKFYFIHINNQHFLKICPYCLNNVETPHIPPSSFLGAVLAAAVFTLAVCAVAGPSIGTTSAVFWHVVLSCVVAVFLRTVPMYSALI